ncbi:glutamate racemase [Comamonas endophytica]|uniref:Glutamate racemase n=1 Tax=Comamonas endophytica TaxID=2949090 RepID=A0ABY6GC73_9BURK|nr:MULTISPECIES: glutamate racemase [unclassified Acidovorax]MCD2513937.1 glutamate racemase [Acidovorax sp. D4N7]UYG51718.1 glutamate racemase [Acidovorax sp. 5MLIR]UYG52069.1 glutamate racemase [Acidovorax sp. 5MLIR]
MHHFPIGIFDSGIGGLSVLQALRGELPQEQLVYVADSGHAPYGERDEAFVQQRTGAIARHLRAQYGIKALVIACNTATAAAVEQLRREMPDLLLIGVEPALKPAAQSSQTHHVGVMATRGTVGSARFARLLAEHSQHTRFSVQACDGLALAIEQATEQPAPARLEDGALWAHCARHTAALGRFGRNAGEIDTLVLGCTHYIFVKDELRALLGPDIALIDTGSAVARQVRRLLEQAGLLAPEGLAPRIELFATGGLNSLQAAAQRWLGLPAGSCAHIDIG